MKKTNSVRLLAFLIIASLLTLALNFAAAPASAQEVIVIKHWYHQYGEAGAPEAVVRYAEEYNKLNPNVRVEVTMVPSDYFTKLNAAFLANEGPDVFESQPRGDYIFSGQALPLNDLFTPEVLADFNPKNLAAVTVNGNIYGIPQTDGTGMLYYRKSLLEAAGVQPPTTMDELITAAKTLTQGRVKGLFIGNDGGSSGQLPKILVWSSGNELVKDGQVAFNNERTVLALQKMKELNDSGALLLGAPLDWWDSSAFMDGLAAMQWGGQWTLPAVKAALGDDFGVVPWPALDEQGTPATWYGGWYAMVNSKSPNVEAAKAYARWLWIENMEAQTDWALSYGSTAPTRLSIVENAPDLREGAAREFIKAIENYGRPESNPFWTSPMDTAITDMVANVLKNNADPVTEVARAAEKIEAELARIRDLAAQITPVPATK